MAFKRNISGTVAGDAELVERYRLTGQSELLAELYGRYMELVYAVCIKYLRDTELSKDAVMDIYEELVHKLPKHEVSNFRSWLYSVARNHCLMKIRSANKPVINIDEDRMQLVAESHQEDEDKEGQFVILSDCLQKLPAEQKNVIDLFYLQQQCYNDIVKQTGYEWNRVRSLVQNGRRNLKICMEKMSQATTRTK